jgi:hypothetical protein
VNTKAKAVFFVFVLQTFAKATRYVSVAERKVDKRSTLRSDIIVILDSVPNLVPNSILRPAKNQ